MKYYVMANSKQNGPLTIEEVADGINNGKFELGNLAWHDGLSDWVMLGSMETIVDAILDDE